MSSSSAGAGDSAISDTPYSAGLQLQHNGSDETRPRALSASPPVFDVWGSSAETNPRAGTLCPWCPCGHIERQLGLLAMDSQDAFRVWVRFASLVLLSCSFWYLLLILGFNRWWNVSGVHALLSLCLVHTFLTGAAGFLASRRRGFDASSSLAPPPWQTSTVAPMHPRALLAAKWSAILPLSLLAFFGAVFLGVALAGWIQVKTEVDLGRRQQGMTVLLLGGNALVALAAQGFLFLSASALQRVGENEPDDLAWQQSVLRAEHGPDVEAHGAGVDPDDSSRTHDPDEHMRDSSLL